MDKIIVKGKFCKWSGYAGEGQIDPTATIELSSRELLEQMKEQGYFVCKPPNDVCLEMKKLLPQPQHIITNSLCDTCQLKHYYSDCPSRENVTICDKYKPVCDCKPQQSCLNCYYPCHSKVEEITVCKMWKLQEFCKGHIIKDNECSICHLPLPPQSEELVSDKEDELENILICFGENFGEVRLEDIDKYVREGKEKILTLVGKVGQGLSIHCDKCGKQLTEFGANLYGVPDENMMCKKTHLCKECYERND